MFHQFVEVFHHEGGGRPPVGEVPAPLFSAPGTAQQAEGEAGEGPGQRMLGSWALGLRQGSE